MGLKSWTEREKAMMGRRRGVGLEGRRSEILARCLSPAPRASATAAPEIIKVISNIDALNLK